jgi:hypothetical protein
VLWRAAGIFYPVYSRDDACEQSNLIYIIPMQEHADTTDVQTATWFLSLAKQNLTFTWAACIRVCETSIATSGTLDCSKRPFCNANKLC